MTPCIVVPFGASSCYDVCGCLSLYWKFCIMVTLDVPPEEDNNVLEAMICELL